MSSSSAPVARKRPQWMLDEMAADPSLVCYFRKDYEIY